MKNKGNLNKIIAISGLFLIFAGLKGTFMSAPKAQEVIALNNDVIKLNGPAYDLYSGNYYDGITATSGKALRDQLKSLISNPYTSIGYSSVADTIYPYSDLRPDGTIWDIYGDYSYHLSSSGGNSSAGAGWNKEHAIPQSWFGEASPMKSDAYHLYPTDAYINNARANYPFGEVGTVTKQFTTKGNYVIAFTSKLGTSKNRLISGTVFEPADCYKGDLARSIFYFAVRYETQMASGGCNKNSEANKVFTKNDDRFHLTSGAAELYMKWHLQDPVSQKEVDRCNGIQRSQKNRNPFIDHPEYVEAIWGNKIVENKDPSSFTISPSSSTIVVGETSQLTLSSNPADANKSCTWSSSNTDIATVSSSGLVTAKSVGSATITCQSKVVSSVKATANITVKNISSISLSGNPAKTSYYEGENFDPTGLTVTAHYSDSSTGIIPNNSCRWVDKETGSLSLTKNTSRIECIYQGFKADIAVNLTITKGVSGKVSFDRESFKASTAYGWYSFSGTGVSGYGYIYGGAADKIQMNTSKTSHYIYNDVALSGNITKVTVYTDSSSHGIKVLTNNTSFGQTSGTPSSAVTTNQMTATSSGTSVSVNGGGKFFAICATSGATYINKVEIEFGGGSTPIPIGEVEAIILSNTNAVLDIGDKLTLTAEVLPYNAENKSLIWSSSNSAICSVQNGVITAKGAGTCQITATSAANRDVTATCSITVNRNIPEPDPTPTPNPDNNKGCLASIGTTSFVICGITSIGVVVLLILRKREVK